MTPRTWILGATPTSHWHLAREEHTNGRMYLVTACRGDTIGGAYGPARRECTRPDEIEHLVCAVCDGIAGTTPVTLAEAVDALRDVEAALSTHMLDGSTHEELNAARDRARAVLARVRR